MNSNNTRIDSPPLVHRPLKHDEWYEGYLVDVARDHGIRRPATSDVMMLLRQMDERHLGRRMPELDAHQAHMIKSGYPRYGGIHMPDWGAFSHIAPARFCPYCVIEDRYHRGRWRLSGYWICSRHRCFLKRDKRVSVSLASWSRKKETPLHQLSEEALLADTESCSSIELHVHQAVWGGFEQFLEGHHPSAAQSVAAGALAAWSALTWSTLDRMARIHCLHINGVVLGNPVSRLAEFLDSHNACADPSHSGILKLFGQLKQYITYAGGMRFVRRVADLERKHTSLLSTVDLEGLYQAILAARPEARVRPESYKRCFVNADGQGQSIKRFGEFLGISQPTAARWARVGRFKTEGRIDRLTSQQRFVPAHEVQAHLRLRRTLLSKDEFIRLNGLDQDIATVLYKSSLLRTVSYARCRLITKESASNLMLKLELQCAPYEQYVSERRVRLLGPEVRSYARNGVDLIALVEAAIRGEVRVFRSLDRPGLSSLDMDEEGLHWLIRQIRNRQFRYLRASDAEAAANLNLF